MYERLKRLYQEGRASEAMLKNAVKRGWITDEEMQEIIASKKEPEDSSVCTGIQITPAEGHTSHARKAVGTSVPAASAWLILSRQASSHAEAAAN